MIPDLNVGVAVLTNQESGEAFDSIAFHVARPLPRRAGVRLDRRLTTKVRARIAAEARAAEAERVGRARRRVEAVAAAREVRRHLSRRLVRRHHDREEGGKLVMRFSHTPALVGDLEHWQHDTFIARWRDRELRADAYVTFALNPDGSIDQAKMRAVSPETDFSFDFQDHLPGGRTWPKDPWQFTDPVELEGVPYLARACGAEAGDGHWHGWIEFTSVDDGEVVRSSRETTQPNREDTLYWATGLSLRLSRGLAAAHAQPAGGLAPRRTCPVRPRFDDPAPDAVEPPRPAESILDPFSVYRKGEALLRRQLAALSEWHLINIIQAHGLSSQSQSELQSRSGDELAALIVEGVRQASARA